MKKRATTSDEILLYIFPITTCPPLRRQAHAKSHLGESATIDFLFVLKSGFFKASYWWLEPHRKSKMIDPSQPFQYTGKFWINSLPPIMLF
jgi:hypothetical protein